MKNILLLLLIIILFGCNTEGHKDSTLKDNTLKQKSLPSFNLLLPDSTTYFNTKDIPNGFPVVLFLFGPKCPYSRAQIQEIIDEMQSLKEIRFYVFTDWSFKEMKSFYENYNLNKFPNILTGVDYKKFFSKYFAVKGVPYMVIYDKNKYLKNIFVGMVDINELKAIVEG